MIKEVSLCKQKFRKDTILFSISKGVYKSNLRSSVKKLKRRLKLWPKLSKRRRKELRPKSIQKFKDNNWMPIKSFLVN